MNIYLDSFPSYCEQGSNRHRRARISLVGWRPFGYKNWIAGTISDFYSGWPRHSLIKGEHVCFFFHWCQFMLPFGFLIAALTRAKTVYRVDKILIQIPVPFFTEMGGGILKFTWKHKTPWRVETILSKKNSSNYHAWSQVTLQSHGSKNSIVLG